MPAPLTHTQGSDTTFIYALLDPRTHEIRYIGKTDDPNGRLRHHISDSKQEKYYKANWIKSLLTQGLKPILEVIDEVSKSEWQPAEAAYIQFYREEGFRLVNRTPGGDGTGSGKDHPSFGIKYSAERCAQMSEALKGEKCYQFGKHLSAETRAKISKARKGKNYGQKLTPEHRAKLLAANKGKSLSVERRAKMSASTKGRIGKIHTPEECAKISAGNKGKKRSAEMRAKLSAINKGKHHTAEARAKMSQARKNLEELKRLERERLQIKFKFDAVDALLSIRANAE